MRLFGDLSQVFPVLGTQLRYQGKIVEATRWQGVEAPQSMLEMYGVSFRVGMGIRENWQDMISPNLPWADEHFQERVSGLPTNPGESYKNWPFHRKSPDEFTNKVFTHTYQERIWPKHANPEGDITAFKLKPVRGIRYRYGDLKDVVALLNDDPLTRQAFLPIWFPEDTGAVHRGRVPCSLGYLFMQREGFLHCTYYIRSCDYFRHFRDDVYLACRLTEWVLDQLDWPQVGLGYLDMHIASLHCWSSERNLLPK